MKKKVKQVEKSYSEFKDIHQRTKNNMENMKKELHKMKQEKETSNHEIEKLRKLKKIQTQAVPQKEQEIRRLTTIIEKEKKKSRTNEITSYRTPWWKQKHEWNECTDSKNKLLSRVNKNNGKRKGYETNISDR